MEFEYNGLSSGADSFKKTKERGEMGKLILLILIVLCCEVWATDGSAFTGHGPNQEGVAGAGAAKAQDSTWINLNPASIIELQSRFDVSLEYDRPNRRTEMRGLFANTNVDQDTGKSFIPNLSMVYKIDEDSAFGVGLFTAAGVNNHLSQPRTTAGVAGNYDKNVDYYSLKLNIVYAKRFANGWSIGFGPSVVFSRLRSDMSTATLAQTAGANEWEDSWGGGFVFGIYKKWDWGAFGVGYSSRQWTEGFDKYEDVIATPLDHPQYVQAGFAFALHEDVDFLIDYKWIDWDSVGQLGRPGSRLGFGWSDSHILKTGLIWRVTDATTLRFGYSYGKSQINDSDVYSNSIFPTPIEHHASFGISHRVSESWEVALSYVHGFKNGLRENNKDVSAANGTVVSLELDFVALGVTWFF